MKYYCQTQRATIGILLLLLCFSVDLNNSSRGVVGFQPQIISTRSRQPLTSSTTALLVSQTLDNPEVSQRSRRGRNSNSNSNTASANPPSPISTIDNPVDPYTLAFNGYIEKTSKPLAISEQDKKSLINFFISSEARDTLFVSDKPPVPVLLQESQQQLYNNWQIETQKLGATMPEEGIVPNNDEEYNGETIMELCSNGISFSGLTVETTVYCGGKLIEPSKEKNDGNDGLLPYYEFTMIQDKTQARGPKFLMWIYKQVMGFVSKTKKTKTSSSPSSSSAFDGNPKTTTSLCRISLIEKDDGLAIHFESSFQVQVKLPSFILKMMPVSKTKAESQGSSAVTNFVEKGVIDSLNRFETVFANYNRQH